VRREGREGLDAGRRRRSPGAAQKEAPHLRGIFRTTTSFSSAIDYVLKFDIQQQ
jgi:hypothetical protein